ncbi:hypothetical protein GOODEAATRI_002495, partial [Goodea atripinnis]
YTCSAVGSSPPPSSRSGFLACSVSVEMLSLDRTRPNEDICFHSGRAGTRPPLPELSETISRHLLAADCSGRFLPLLVASDTAIWTGRGVAQVAL